MRTDKLAVLATVLGVFYLVLKGTGAPEAQRPVMPPPVAIYHAPVRVYHPPRRVYHPPPHRQKIPVIFGHLPLPIPRRPPVGFRPPIQWLPLPFHRFKPPKRRIGRYAPL